MRLINQLIETVPSFGAAQPAYSIVFATYALCLCVLWCLVRDWHRRHGHSFWWPLSLLRRKPAVCCCPTTDPQARCVIIDECCPVHGVVGNTKLAKATKRAMARLPRQSVEVDDVIRSLKNHPELWREGLAGPFGYHGPDGWFIRNGEKDSVWALRARKPWSVWKNYRHIPTNKFERSVLAEEFQLWGDHKRKLKARKHAKSEHEELELPTEDAALRPTPGVPYGGKPTPSPTVPRADYEALQQKHDALLERVLLMSRLHLHPIRLFELDPRATAEAAAHDHNEALVARARARSAEAIARIHSAG